MRRNRRCRAAVGGDDAGKTLYDRACIACHEADGTGAPRIYPPLPGNANLQSADPSSTLRIILDGAQTVTTTRAPNAGSMPAYAKQMSDQEIADVTNYIRNSWGNAAPLVSAAAGRKGAEIAMGISFARPALNSLSGDPR